MAELSAPGRRRESAENLQFSAARRDHRLKSKSMIRSALAAFLAILLAQLTMGEAFERIAEANPGGLRALGLGAGHEAELSATAEALARAAPVSIAPPAPVISDPAPAATTLLPIPTPAEVSACPRDMVLVEGEYCTEVLQVCARWLDDETLPFARCAEYHAPSRCIGSRVHERFCIDRYEYTAPGQDLPLNYQSFSKASSLCGSFDKRLCTEGEWNFACEGEEMRPYPYGFKREPKCNQDRDDLYEANPHRQILADRRERADARPECVSPFGVYNMAGNMDESVLREGPEHVDPFRNALKGGWWMPARNRCRPATTAHDDYYNDIQVGVRCCSSPT
jgi:formylglycine-generating enzyme